MESAKTSQPASDVESQPQKKLSAKEILADIREEMSDQALEQKYHLTREGRENIFGKLIAAGLMTETELNWRNKFLTIQKASGNSPVPQDPNPTPVTPRDTDQIPRTTLEHPSTWDSKITSIESKFRDGYWIEDRKILVLLLIVASPLGLYGLWKTSRFQTVTKVILAVITVALVILLRSIAIYLWVIVGVVALVYILWGHLKGAKQQVKPVSTPLQRVPQTVSIHDQPGQITQPPRSAGPVSAEEIEEAIKRMESARRDIFGIAGDVGILGIGAAGGGIAAAAVAAFFGATRIWGVTTAGKWLGLSVQGSTPWTWIIGSAIVGAVLAFSISRLVGLSAKIEERQIRTLEDLRNQIRIRQQEAERSKVDKDKYQKLQESLTMLLSNGKITPEESDGLINGIKNGTITYEFAFDSIEDCLKE